MKFNLAFKTPNVLDQIDFHIQKEDTTELKKFIESFLSFGEYVSISFDSEAQTATVLRNP